MKISGLQFGKTSLYARVLRTILLVIVIVIAFMEISNLYVLGLYRNRAKDSYRTSLKMYSDYWDNLFGVINNAVVSAAESEYDTYYNDLLYRRSGMELEIAKVMMMRKLNSISQMYGNRIMTFCYVPDRELFIQSTKNVVEYASRAELTALVKQAVRESAYSNTSAWKYLSYQGKAYFIQYFQREGGLVGTMITGESVLDEIMGDQSSITEALLLDSDGNTLYRTGAGGDGTYAGTLFTEPLEMLDAQIGFVVTEQQLYSDQTLFFTVMAGLLAVGALAALVNIQMQKKLVLKPLDKLRVAMERFSAGAIDERLDEKVSSGEIRTLYHTFNDMASQIANLKIGIYETELEKQKIQSRFLRLQIQPHFYSNILYLIYGMAETKDYQSIKQITLVTSRYFRYLLMNKNEEVTVGQELDCVDAYVQIQKIRYPGCIEFAVTADGVDRASALIPLLIQTFVENSVKHNVTFVQTLRISVDLRAEEDKLTITVTDNGTGFSRESLDRLNADGDISDDGKHIGIANVRQRLKRTYGENGKLAIESEDQQTTVRVSIPLRRLEPSEGVTQ